MIGRRTLVEAVTLGTLGLVAACALLGGKGPFPQPLTTSGTGPFRAVTSDETGLTRPVGNALVGRIMEPPSGMVPGIERAMIAANRLFATIAQPLASPPARDPTLPSFAFDPGQFQDRGIYVFCPLDVEPLQAGCLDELERVAFGFNVNRILVPAEAWEGTELFDPWAIELDGGAIRLYYAAAGGIGVAEASELGGTFTRLRTTPILTPSGSMTVARSPTVIHDDELGWFMYFDGGDGIYVASSDDGLAFTLENGGAPLDLLRSDEELPDDSPFEREAHHPGATFAMTPLGRRVVRLYFSVWRVDAMDIRTSVLSMAGSLDGVTFDRFAGYSFAEEVNADAPAPFLLDDGASTLLVATAQLTGPMNLQLRAPIGLVTPIDYAFPFVPPPATP